MEYFFRNVVKGVFPHTICRRKVAVMDQMADLDKLKPNEGPKKEPKEIPEKRNHLIIDSFKIVSTTLKTFLKLNLCQIFFLSF